MATDVARLALAIDVTGAKRAQSAMEQLQAGSVRLTRATDEQVAAQFRLNSSFQASAVSSRRMAGAFRLQKGAIQQAGYQIGDFAVQVGAGQSALVAFAQQGSQLAGIFGPGGAVLGAVIAIGGAIAGGLVRAFSDGSDEAKTLAERIRDVADSTDELTAAQVRALKADFFATNRDRLQNIVAERQRIKELNEEIAENERLMSQQAGQRDTGMGGGILGTTVQGLRNQAASTEQLAERNRELRKELDDTQASIDTYFQASDQINQELQELIFGEGEHAKSIDRTRERIQELNESLQFQVDTYGQSERAIELAKIQQLAKNGADAEAVRRAQELTNALYDQIEAERQQSRMQRDLAQLDPAGAEFNRYADQIDRIEEYNISASEKERLREAAFEQHQQRMIKIANDGSQSIKVAQEQGLQMFRQSQQQTLGAIGDIFGNMAAIAEKGGKDQFNSWKAMASAQAAVNTALAISNALAVPPPPVGIALASTIGALGAVQIAQIQQTEYQGSYLGGGYTGSGSRTGGVDGKGGFPAILHPNETVIDHERGQGMGGDVNVVINNAPAGTGANVTRERDGTITIDMFQADMVNGGPMWKSIASVSGLRRQGR